MNKLIPRLFAAAMFATAMPMVYAGNNDVESAVKLHAIYEHADAADSDHPGHVDQSSNDYFDYSHDYFEKNFSYTYTDEKGVSHTVPITTPATTEPMMRALVKEVWTNRAIPGRRWVREVEPGRSHYVSYVIDENDPSGKILDIAPGDYTPMVDGLTALLVEGQDEDVAGYTMQDIQEHNLFNRLKSISLITSRMYIPDNDFELEGEKGLNSGPGYIFTFHRQLRKFFVITKGKARNIAWGNEIEQDASHNWDYIPFSLLFEEFSPNEASDRNPRNVYYDLLDGEHMFVTHDCSSALTNSHWMRMIAAESNAPVDINLSLFVPDYRNYNDGTGTNSANEFYTWYDENHMPFFYCYAIYLTAYPEKADADALLALEESGKIIVPNSPGHNNKFERNYWVKLDWITNFRYNLFNSVSKGEFMIYRVIDGIVDTTPILTFMADKEGNIIKVDSDGNTVLTIHPDGKLTSNAAIGTQVYVLEPQALTGRHIQYICGGKPEGFTDSDYTFSNVATVYIPGYNFSERLLLDITSSERSTFVVGEPVNQYSNELTMLNRNDDLAISTLDLIGESAELYGEGTPVFTLWRVPETVDEMGNFIPMAPVKVSAITIDRTLQSNKCYFTGKVSHFNPDGTIDSQKEVDYTPGVNETNTVRWMSPGSYDENKAIQNMYPLEGTDPNILIVWHDDFEEAIPADNSHPVRYTYFVEFTRGDRSLESNEEEVPVYKAQIEVAPTTFTAQEIYGDMKHELEFDSYDLKMRLRNSPYVEHYRVRFADGIRPFSRAAVNDLPSDDILAEVRISNDRFTMSRRSTETYRQLIVDSEGNQQYITTTMLEPIGEPISVTSGEEKDINITLNREHVFNDNGSPRQLTIQTAAQPHRHSMTDDILNTYGSNYAEADNLPQIYVTMEMQGVTGQEKLNRMTSGTITTTWDNVTDYEVIGVDHYKIWNTLNNEVESIMHDHSRSMPYHDYENFANAVYLESDNSTMYFTQGYLDPNPSHITRGDYIIRAYIAVRPKAQAGDDAQGVRHIASTDDVNYLIAETRVTAVYNPDKITTGVETEITDTDTLTAISGNQPVIIGQGPIRIYSTSGALVTVIDDNAASRVLTDIPSGVYIATGPTSSVKFIKN